MERIDWGGKVDGGEREGTLKDLVSRLYSNVFSIIIGERGRALYIPSAGLDGQGGLHH